jgi:hypothetical protein
MLVGCSSIKSDTHVDPLKDILTIHNEIFLDGNTLNVIFCPELSPVYSGDYASAPVEFIVSPSGKVLKNSAHISGRVLFNTQRDSREEPHTLAKSDALKESVRLRARKKVERCIFQPPHRNGTPVYVKVKYRFNVAY